jgi:hypothetical protein
MSEEEQARVDLMLDPALKAVMSLERLWLPSLKMVENGITPGQRNRHLYILHDVLLALRSKELNLDPTTPLVPALLKCLDYLRTVRGWKAASTIAGYAATLYGALERLDQYSSQSVGIHLKEWKYGSMWKDAMKSFTAKAMTYTPKVFATHPAIAQKLLTNLTGETLMLCALNWLHAARNKNSSELLCDNITFLGDGKWKVEWSHAKTKKMEDFIAQRKKEEPGDHTPLIPPHKRAKATAELSRALKAEDPQLSLHTMRRGALGAMAKAGTELETLLVFSGHSGVPSLLKYIQRGSYFNQRVEKGAAAARSALLMKSGSSPATSSTPAKQ